MSEYVDELNGDEARADGLVRNVVDAVQRLEELLHHGYKACELELT
jgi:hypothetical protein